MNEARKLSLSKETLRCLDDQDLTEVVGGHSDRNHGGGNSNDCGNSNNCQGSFICISAGCNSGVCSGAFFC